MSDDILARITASILEGDPDATVDVVNAAIGKGLAPMAIIEKGLMPGMNEVGDRFSKGEFFLPQLIIAARCMQLAMELLQPLLLARKEAVKTAGTVVIGTVKGDIHEIGKSLVATMLSANGFKVYDLGVNVTTEDFVAKVKETGANLLGLSALLTTTMTVQREVIEALQKAGLRKQVKVLLGGAPVNQQWCDSIGADGYAEDAVGAVALARQLVG